MPRWSVDIIRHRAEHLGTVEAPNQAAAIKKAADVAPGADPSLTFANSAPPPRQDVWHQRDVLRLVERAWREEYFGLAALLAVAWDTMLSPIDVRSLTVGQRVPDDGGAVFLLDRANTGRAAVGTLTRWSEAILDAYLAKLGIELHAAAPLFWTRGGNSTAKGGRPWPLAAIPVTASGSISGTSETKSSVFTTSGRSRTWVGLVPSKQCAATRPRLSCRPRWRTPSAPRTGSTAPTCPSTWPLSVMLTQRERRGGNETGPKSCNCVRSNSCNRNNPPDLSR
jgi:hypothetical protein